jgi:hypothetical protein
MGSSKEMAVMSNSPDSERRRTIARVALLTELDRLITAFPNRWSKLALVAVTSIAHRIDPRELVELLDTLDPVLRERLS